MEGERSDETLVGVGSHDAFGFVVVEKASRQ